MLSVKRPVGGNMPAILGWRALLYLATAVGIGSWFGGDKTYNYGDVSYKTNTWTWVDWVVGGIVVISLVWLVIYLLKKWKK